MSTRKFFDDVQMGMESGGRQHDSQGKPLVGRYRDGSTPPESKKAYGAGQMQIGTAKATAAKHNIAWDESKFLNDKEYNLNLADAHMRDLTVKYGGDRTKARAAYHSGEGTVDKAIKKYGSEGFGQGLGPEGRKYIGMATYNSTSGGKGVADPSQFLAGLESSLGAQTASSDNVSSRADKIFGSDSEMASRGNAVETQLQNQAGAIDVLDQATQAMHSAQTTAMEQQINETRAINDQIVTGTQALKDKVAPVIQARGQIADQLDKVNSMNPLERTLRGVFDLNYDKKYLERKLGDYDATMKARSSDYEYLNSLHATAMQAIDRRYALDTSIPGLAVKQADEDLALVGMRIQQTSASLGALRDQISGQSQLIAAKAAAREDMMGQLDGPTLNKLMASAQASGGVVTHGGVQLTYNELYERSQVKEQQLLNMEAVRMSIAGNRMDMADKYATNLARSLTRKQLEGAIANGGMYDGIQLPQDVLTRQYGSIVQRDQVMAESAANNLPASQAAQVGTDALNMTVGLYRRSKDFYGETDFRTSSTIMSNGAQAVRELSEAIQTGQPPEVISALTQKVAKSQKAMQDHTDGVILRQVGGDQKAASYLKGFVYGTPLSQGAAVEGMAYFAVKGNLPTGMQNSPEAAAVFKQAQGLVKQFQGQNFPGTNRPYTQKQLTEAVTRELTQTATDTVGVQRFNTLYADLPALARRANHPLGRLKTQDWRMAQAAAKQDAITMAAQDLGISYERTKIMYDTSKPYEESQMAKDQFEKFKSLAPRINANEARNLAANLDELPQVTPGRRNSSVMLDYMHDGRFNKQINDYTTARGNQAFSDYLVNPLAAGATQANLAATADVFTDQRAQEYASRRQLARQQPAGTLMDPAKRAAVYFGSMNGVSSDGAKVLAPYVAQIVKGLANDEANFRHIRSGNLTVNSMIRDQDAAIYEGLKSLKITDNPAAETVRKNAVSAWPQTQVQSKGFIESIIETGSQFFDLDGR